MRGIPTFQPYAPWLITMGRSAFLGSRPVHMVSASMSKLSKTGNPFGESGMACLRREGELERHRARAGTRALEVAGQGEDPAVAVPGTDDLEADRQAVGRPAARQRDRRVAGEVEGPEIGIPGAADGAGGLARDRDRLERVVVDGERGSGQRRR